MSSTVKGTPAGHPSIVTPIPAPWDSPHVEIVKILPKLLDMAENIEFTKKNEAISALKSPYSVEKFLVVILSTDVFCDLLTIFLSFY